MNCAQKLIVFGILVLGCVSVISALSCYSCNTVNSCKNPQKTGCNQQNANATRAYLDMHYKNVNMNTTSNSYNCFSEMLKVATGDFQYKGCLYQTISACSLQLRDVHTQGTNKRTCSQCNNKDYCNPAGRADINVMTVLATISAAVIAKYAMAH